MVIAAGTIFWWKMGVKEGVLIFIAAIVSQFGDLLKILIERPRPSSGLVQVLVNEPGYSFPSGHATFVTVFLGIVAYLVYTHLPKGWFSRLIIIILFLVILWVGSSRIYLGVHWPSDVLGGYLIGGLILWILTWLNQVLD